MGADFVAVCFWEHTCLTGGGALIGGIFLGFGARWADGCTSGHGISGALQLAVSSWISALAFFVSGILVAHILFRLIAG
jgi:uncharacterized protein